MTDAANQLIATHGDHFDFIGFFLSFKAKNPLGAAFYQPIFNDVSGIGLELAGHGSYGAFDNAAANPLEAILGGWYRLSESNLLLRGGVGTGLNSAISAVLEVAPPALAARLATFCHSTSQRAARRLARSSHGSAPPTPPPAGSSISASARRSIRRCC